MPQSLMTLFPHMLNSLEAMKLPLQAALAINEVQVQSVAASTDFCKSAHDMALSWARNFSHLLPPGYLQNGDNLLKQYQEGATFLLELIKENWIDQLNRFHQQRAGELEFLNLFTAQCEPQEWSVECDRTKILLDLPGMRLIDISTDVRHRIHNYGVVFAPRAGHHSNIAERVALFLRDQGLTRMAVVEQKCAEDIPLNVNGHRHREDFEGQVDQYRQVLELLKLRTGHSPHLIAICQPGPLLLSTLILHPELGKTFGSAGSPMHTEAEKGFLTDFARKAGEGYIDRMLAFFGHTIGEDHAGAGRLTYDGRLQVLGFYLMAWDQHYRNYKKLLNDMKNGDNESARRQKAFYQWYNTVHHFPAGFIRDTYKKIFVQNALIRGYLKIGDRKVDIANYPVQTPLWALGGESDHIAPPKQAVGHMDLMPEMPAQNQLRLLCDAGHMGLFRSQRVLEKHYRRIADFLLTHSDYANRKFIYN
jgi:polyhydroxyalkanoate depolymerase